LLSQLPVRISDLAISEVVIANLFTEQERALAADPAEIFQDVNLLPFVNFEEVTPEVLNAIKNFLANEVMSVRHQIQFLYQHYQSLHTSSQEVNRVALSRMQMDDVENGPLIEMDASAAGDAVE
jgi:hypothetical protein